MFSTFSHGRRNDNTEMYNVACIYVKETEKAWLLQIGFREYWLPKSQVTFDKDSVPQNVSIPQWLVEENGIDID